MEHYLTLSGIHDFVQQVARYNSLKLLFGHKTNCLRKLYLSSPASL